MNAAWEVSMKSEEGAAWPWVRIDGGGQPVLALKDEGFTLKEEEAARVKFRGMTPKQLLEVASGTVPKKRILPLLMEGALRGMLSLEGKKRLAALLDEKDAARVQAEQDRRFRARFGGLGREEVFALTAGEGRAKGWPTEQKAETAEAPKKEREWTPENDAECLRLGLNPTLMQRMGEVHSVDDYRRIKGEVEGGGN